jgi:hypothetical protein
MTDRHSPIDRQPERLWLGRVDFVLDLDCWTNLECLALDAGFKCFVFRDPVERVGIRSASLPPGRLSSDVLDVPPTEGGAESGNDRKTSRHDSPDELVWQIGQTEIGADLGGEPLN